MLVSPSRYSPPVALVKKCRHGRGKAGRARVAAWRGCVCGWYADIRVNGARVYVPLGHDEKRARVEHAQLVADREAGRLEPTVGGAGSVGELLDAWRTVHSPGVKPSTAVNYRTHHGVIRRYFGADTLAARIRTRDLADFRDALAAELSPKNAANVFGNLLAVLSWAEARGDIQPLQRPAAARRRPDSPEPRLTVQEADRTIAAIRNPLTRAMAEVALVTGLRRGELLGLTTDSVRLDAGILSVDGQLTDYGPGTPKTATSARVVGLSPRAVEILRERVDSVGDGERLFPLHPRTVGRQLTDAMRAAGTYRKQRGWHSLRHANAHLREASGESVRSAAAALGHGSNFAMTLAYGWAAEAAPSPAIDAAREAMRQRRP